MKMPKEMKEKWLAALRGNEYPQGYMQLQDYNGGYCCLGVLEMVCDGKVERASMRGGPVLTYPTEDWCLSHKVDFSPAEMRILGQMNDGKPDPFSAGQIGACSFSEIADFIEKEVEAV